MLTAIQKEVLDLYLDDYDPTVPFEKVLFQMVNWDQSVLIKLEHQEVHPYDLAAQIRARLELLKS